MQEHLPNPRLHAYRKDLADRALARQVKSARYADLVTMIVRTPAAPLHQTPDPQSIMVSEALMGEAVKVFEQKNGWCWGQMASDGYVGYIPAQMLVRLSGRRTFRRCRPGNGS